MKFFSRAWRSLLVGAMVPTVVGQISEARAEVAPGVPAIRRPDFMARAWSPQEFYSLWNGVLTDDLYHARLYLLAAEQGNRQAQGQAVQYLTQSCRNTGTLLGAYFGAEVGRRFEGVLQEKCQAFLEYVTNSIGGNDEGRRTASDRLMAAKDRLVQGMGEVFQGLDWVPEEYEIHLQGEVDHARWDVDARLRRDPQEDMVQMGHLKANKEARATALAYHLSKKFNPKGEAIPSDLAAFNSGVWATTMAIQGNAGLLVMKEGGMPDGLGLPEVEMGLSLLWGNLMWNSRLIGLAVEEGDEGALRDLLEVRSEIRAQWRTFLAPFCDPDDIDTYQHMGEEMDQRWLEIVRQSRREPASLAQHTYTNRMLEFQGPIVEATVDLYKRRLTPRAMLVQAIQPMANMLLMAQGMAIDTRSALVRDPGSMPPRRITAGGGG